MPKFLSEKGLIERAYQIAGGAIKDLPLDQIYQLVTVTHYVTPVKGALMAFDNTVCSPCVLR